MPRLVKTCITRQCDKSDYVSWHIYSINIVLLKSAVNQESYILGRIKSICLRECTSYYPIKKITGDSVLSLEKDNVHSVPHTAVG